MVKFQHQYTDKLCMYNVIARGTIKKLQRDTKKITANISKWNAKRC